MLTGTSALWGNMSRWELRDAGVVVAWAANLQLHPVGLPCRLPLAASLSVFAF